MKLVCWNVNGIRAVRKKGFADFVRRSKADVISIQEPKVGRSQIDEVDISTPGYQHYFSLAEKKGYSGVVSYVSDKLKTPPNSQENQQVLGIEKFDREGRVVVTDVGDITLYNIYFPSGTTGDIRQDYKYEFLDAVYQHIENLKPAVRKKLIVCGDFNICHRELDIHHPETAERQELSGFLPEEREWMDRFEELGMLDSFRLINGDKADKYTWWSYRAGARDKNLGWRIDYFWVSKELKDRVSKATILNRTTGSDHCPIVLELS